MTPEKAQTIPELTNNEYNELCYNSAGTLIKGDFVTHICFLLNKNGIEIAETNEYNDVVASAVLEFQKSVDLPETGNLNNDTFKKLILHANEMSDSIEDEGQNSTEESEEQSDSPHYNSFFGDEKYKMHRRNHKDIKIVFGNDNITKTIKDVFMLSVSVEVDTSGNPIFEVYEFVARDIIESDEINDINKYATSEPATAKTQKYNFSSIGVR